MPANKKPPKASRQKGGRIDWDAIERDYRTDKYTQTELANKYGVDQATLSRKIKSDKVKNPNTWEKDLSALVEQATKSRLIKETVKSVIKEGQEANAVLIAAEVNAQVIIGQRTRVQNAVSVTMRLLGELDASTTTPESMAEMFRVAATEMDGLELAAFRSRVNDFLRLHNRVGSAQKLMVALKDAQALERQAFGIQEDKGNRQTNYENLTDSELAEAIRELSERVGGS